MKQAIKQIVRSTGLERRHLVAARMCCERHVLAAVGRARKRWIGRTLCYHSIGQDELGLNDVSEKQFRRHIEAALNAGYNFVPASQIAETGGREKELAITFDDGARSVATVAAPILKEYGLPWTFFPVSGWTEHTEEWTRQSIMGWRDIEALLSAGAEMGSHSATHPDFSKISVGQMTDELGGSRDLFARRLGFAPSSFAIPFGQSGNWKAASMAAARDAGYSVIYAQAEETRPTGTIARSFVTKFDGDRIFKALLAGKFDRWEEWV